MKKLFIGLAFAFIAGIFMSLVSAQTYNCPYSGMMGGYRGMMYGGYGSGAMIFGWLISILVAVLIVAAIYWLIKSANKKR